MNRTALFFALTAFFVAGIAGTTRISRAQEKKTIPAPAMAAAQPAMTAPAVPAPMTPAAPMPPPPTISSSKSRGGIFSKVYLADIFAVFVYSMIGLFIALIGYKVYDIITPFDLRKELEIDQNTSLGIVVGSIILGLCLIIAASIMSP